MQQSWRHIAHQWTSG